MVLFGAIHPTWCKVDSANFALTEFSEVRLVAGCMLLRGQDLSKKVPVLGCASYAAT